MEPKNDTPQFPTDTLNADELARARDGVERFKHFFNSLSDPELQSTLLRSPDGQDIQAVFLGIKPAAGLFGDKRIVTIIASSPEMTGLKVAGSFIYDEERLRQVLQKDPDIFPDYSETSINNLLIGLSKDQEIDYRKLGMVLGFPSKAAESYQKNNRALERFFELCLLPSLSFLPVEQRTLARGYIYTQNENGEYTPEAADNFRDTNRAQIENLLHSQFPDMTPKEISYLVNLRNGPSIKGFGYIKVPSEEDIHLKTKVDAIFEASGMNALITSLSSTTSAHIR